MTAFHRAAQSLVDLPWWGTGYLGVALRTCLGPRDGGRIGILTYHRIAPSPAGLPAPEHNVAPQQFAKQLRGLQSRGFQFWSLQRVLDYVRDGVPIPAKTSVVTFDDGYSSVYEHAWPVLRELSIPATIFVSTGFLDSDQPFPFDGWGVRYHSLAPRNTYVPMSRAQAHELNRDDLIELAAHTHTHADFRGRPLEFAADLRECVEVLRTEFGCEDVPFAFPFGYAGEELASAARDTEVRCGLTTEAALVDPASDQFAWGRFNVFPWDTGETLSAKLSGWYSWAPRAWRAMRGSLARVSS